MSTPSDPPLLEHVEDPFLDLWAEFHAAHWTLDKPTRPGIYMIASLEGDYVGLREYVLRDGQLIDTLARHGEPGWLGLFYACPLPPPPKEVPANVRRIQ